MAYGPTQYGPPPHQSPYGAPPSPYGAPPQPYGPPPAPAKKKSVGLIIGLIAVPVVLILVVVAIVLVVMRVTRPSLPVDANILPTETKTVGTHVIDATRESDAHVKQMYLAAELGSLCTGGSGLFDAARRVETIGSGDAKAAKEMFFSKTQMDDIKTQLDCGTVMSKNLKDPKASYLLFDDEDGKKVRSVTVLKLGMTDLPADAGFDRETFGGTPGFCHRGKPAPLFPPPGSLTSAAPPSGGPPPKCEDESRAAFTVGSTWFFGSKESLDGLAESVNHPKKDLGTNAAALKDAASEMTGLPSVRLVAQPKSSKDFFLGACEWGAFQSAMPIKDFKDGCFPEKSEDKIIEEIDAKVRAAGWEYDTDVAKAGAIVANMVLVMRDNDAAKDAERAVNELVRDWKTHIEDHSAKVIKDTRDKAKSPRQKEFSAIVDTYFQALSKAKVSRDGRSLKIGFKQNLTKEDKQSLIDADRDGLEKRQATADVLDAIQQRRPLPIPALTKLVGKSWAGYLAGPPPPPPVAAGGPTTTLTTAECDSLKLRITPITITDLPMSDTAVTDAYFKHRYVVCSIDVVTVPVAQKSCLMTFSSAAEYTKCVSNADPREPPSAEFGKEK
jgi:hypothetical protein